MFTYIVNFLFLNVNEYLKIIIIVIESVFIVDLLLSWKSDNKAYIYKANKIAIISLLVNVLFVIFDSYTKVYYHIHNIINGKDVVNYQNWVATSNFYYTLNYDSIVNFAITLPILFLVFTKTIKNNI
jgi:hypothetical protein